MITVFGLGFVGLTTALGFAHHGHPVYGIDTNQERVGLLKSDKLPFFEPHMEAALKEHNNRNFNITQDVRHAVSSSQFVFYCVGTPYGENGEADLHYLCAAIEETLRCIDRSDEPKILIIKSTIPPSTTRDRIIPFIEERGLRVGNDIFIANNPEFLREGYCWEDFINADRIVIGCENPAAEKQIAELYKPFNRPIHTVTYNTAEFIKYLSNTMLATMISYSNEMSLVADAIGGIEIAKAFHILHEDKRWGNGTMSSYVYPGCGYGGYCLPKDTNALYAISRKNGYDPTILGDVIRLNDDMIPIITRKIMDSCQQSEKLGILGLSFKPKSNDVRDSVPAKVIKGLMDNGYTRICGYDPVANEEFRDHYGFEMTYCNSLGEICESADVLVILTGWEEFLTVERITEKRVLDFRYIL